MTTYHDVPADLLIGELSARLAEMEAISPPEWSTIVKTGTHRERPPTQDNWWFIRSAAILRKVGKLGPIGQITWHNISVAPRTEASNPTEPSQDREISLGL